MPTYEYECNAAGHRFERFQKFSDPPVQECPECGASVRRLIFPPPVIFNAPGFYTTEYGRRRGAAAGKDGETGESKAEDSTAAKPAEASKAETSASDDD